MSIPQTIVKPTQSSLTWHGARFQSYPKAGQRYIRQPGGCYLLDDLQGGEFKPCAPGGSLVGTWYDPQGRGYQVYLKGLSKKAAYDQSKAVGRAGALNAGPAGGVKFDPRDWK